MRHSDRARDGAVLQSHTLAGGGKGVGYPQHTRASSKHAAVTLMSERVLQKVKKLA